METDHIAHAARLETLTMALRGSGLTAEMTDRGLRVVNPHARGCCAPHPSVILTCRQRDDDGGRLWYVTAYQDPIAEADHITDALVAIKSLLEGRPS
jgi:hypothetical protein